MVVSCLNPAYLGYILAALSCFNDLCIASRCFTAIKLLSAKLNASLDSFFCCYVRSSPHLKSIARTCGLMYKTVPPQFTSRSIFHLSNAFKGSVYLKKYHYCRTPERLFVAWVLPRVTRQEGLTRLDYFFHVNAYKRLTAKELPFAVIQPGRRINVYSAGLFQLS